MPVPPPTYSEVVTSRDRTPRDPEPTPGPTPEPRRGPGRDAGARPVTLVVAAVLLALQAVGFVGLTAAIVADGVRAGDAAAGIATAVFTAVVALGAALVAVGLWRRRRWSRGPAVAWSVLVVLVGASQFSVNPGVAVAIIVVGLVGAVAAASPATREAVTGERSGAEPPPSR